MRARRAQPRLLGDRRLIIATNRGPVTFATAADGSLRPRRGSGGLVTALGQVGRHVPVTWVAAAMSEGDRRAAADPRLAARGRRATTTRPAALRIGRARRSTSRPTTSSPTRCCGSSSTRCGTCRSGRSSTPAMMRAWERGYVADERGLRRAPSLAQTRGDRRAADHAPRLPPLPAPPSRSGAPARRRILSHFTHIPWPPSSIWQTIAPADPRGHRHRAARQRRRRLPDRALRAQLPAHGRVVRAGRDGRLRDERRCGAGAGRRTCGTYPISIDVEATRRDRRRRAPRGAAPTSCWAGRASRSSSASTGSSRRRTSCAASSPTRRSSQRQPRLRGRISFLAFLVPSRTGLREYGHYGRDGAERGRPHQRPLRARGLAPGPALLRERLRPGPGRPLDRRRRARQPAGRRHEPRRQGGGRRLRARRGARPVGDRRCVRPDGRWRPGRRARRRGRHRRRAGDRAGHAGRGAPAAPRAAASRRRARGHHAGGCAASSRTLPSSPAEPSQRQLRRASAGVVQDDVGSGRDLAAGPRGRSRPPPRSRRAGGPSRAAPATARNMSRSVMSSPMTTHAAKAEPLDDRARGGALVAEPDRPDLDDHPAVPDPQAERLEVAEGRDDGRSRRLGIRRLAVVDRRRHALVLEHHARASAARAPATSSSASADRLRAGRGRRLGLPGSSHSVPWLPTMRTPGTPTSRRASSGVRPVMIGDDRQALGQRGEGAIGARRPGAARTDRRRSVRACRRNRSAGPAGSAASASRRQGQWRATAVHRSGG